jgi:hypothetical protein
MYTENTARSIPSAQHVAEATVTNLYRRRLARLCNQRFGNHVLSNDDTGRAMLTALLRFGLTDDSANECAPWCETKLPKLKRQARRMKWRDVGKLIGLTTDELVTFNLWITRPADKSPEQYEQWKKARKKEQDKNRAKAARQKRKKQKEAALAIAKKTTTNHRDEAILTMLGDHPTTVSELVKKASKLNAFVRSGSATWTNGPPAHAIVRNLPLVIRRTLDRLEAKGAIQTWKRIGNHGPERRIILAHKQAENGAPAHSESTGTPVHSPEGHNLNKIKGFSENRVRHAPLERDGVSQRSLTTEASRKVAVACSGKDTVYSKPTTALEKVA